MRMPQLPIIQMHVMKAMYDALSVRVYLTATFIMLFCNNLFLMCAIAFCTFVLIHPHLHRSFTHPH